MSDHEKYLDVLQNIEFGLKQVYENNADASDSDIIISLPKAIISIKQKNGFAKNQDASPKNQTEKDVIDYISEIAEARIGKINNLTLKEYIKCINKVEKSVKRHNAYGRRGYYEFIKNYV